MNDVLRKLIVTLLLLTACLRIDKAHAVESAELQAEVFAEQCDIAETSSDTARRKRAIAIIQGIATGNFSNHVPSGQTGKLATNAAELYLKLSSDNRVGEDAIAALGVVLATKPSDVANSKKFLDHLTDLTDSQSLRKQVASAIALKNLLDGHDITKPTTAFKQYVKSTQDTILNANTNAGVRTALLATLIAKGDTIATSEAETSPAVLAAAKKKAEAAKTTAEAAAKKAAAALIDATAQTTVAQDLVDNGGLTGDALQAAKVNLEKRKLLQAQAKTADTTAKAKVTTTTAEVTRLGKLKAPNKDALPIVAESLGQIANTDDLPASIAIPVATALAKYLKALQTPVSDIAAKSS
ncbi:MAG: hypothetical protein AAGG48_10715 [Planctomycetota bacterium]